jgi:hypothetical protein
LEDKMEEKFIIVWMVDGETMNLPHSTPAAKQRQGMRGDRHPEKFSTSSNGRALDKVAADGRGHIQATFKQATLPQGSRLSFL